MTDREQEELLSRARRTETRVTQIAIAMGIGTKSQSPEFIKHSSVLAQVKLPSPHCTMKEILDSVPSTWDGPVDICIGDQMVATLRRG